MKKGIRRYFIILIVIIVCIVTLVDCTNTQTRQEERTSASHLIINWENEVQIFDADAMENTGMVENIETLAWIAPRGGAGKMCIRDRWICELLSAKRSNNQYCENGEV